jgi:hypothetical protein
MSFFFLVKLETVTRPIPFPIVQENKKAVLIIGGVHELK